MLETEIDMVECGQLMGNWHSGQGDPVYMVGSLFRGGKDYPDLEVVDRALNLIERERNQEHADSDQEDLCKIVDFLNAYLAEKGYFND